MDQFMYWEVSKIKERLTIMNVMIRLLILGVKNFP